MYSTKNVKKVSKEMQNKLISGNCTVRVDGATYRPFVLNDIHNFDLNLSVVLLETDESKAEMQRFCDFLMEKTGFYIEPKDLPKIIKDKGF